ncbi:MAG: hypothetical protein GTO40_05120 [Deltaproteobacteria bacterium]|nr:hypothetical protein [Deltaproteobacteria bacterium]
MKKNAFWLTTSLLALLILGPRVSVNAEELIRVIRYLLDYVKHSQVVFIRNNKEHTAGEAEDHMRKKYEHFKDQIKTPEDFIKFAGTKSLLSGRPYRVKLNDGTTMPSQKWLESVLADYRSKNGG